MKKFILMSALVLSITLSACSKEPKIEYEVINQDHMTIFTKQQSGNIGDVMPFYHDGVWNFFYLHDSAPKPGFHPWYRLSTTNFTEFTDHGEVVPVVHDLESQELALGTGSVIEKDGTFYAFYTAHNGRLVPKEMFMLSISTDNMTTWTKQSLVIDPRDYGFDSYDFRDPHVVYIPEKNQYYMLFTTRYLGKGAIGYLTSTDLLTWTKESNGIFFLNNTTNGTQQIDSNLECPTLWYFNGYWYLTFSDQWPTRVTHYLYKENFTDEWIRPEMNVFDGRGLYAGKVSYSDTQMILGGWVSHDFNRSNEFGWGGSFIAHELKQNPNGTLYVDLIKSIGDTINHPQALNITDSYIDGATVSHIQFRSTNQYQQVTFNDLDGISIIEGYLNIESIDGSFGLFFDYRDSESSYHYDFNLDTQRISFFRGHYTQRTSDRLYAYNTFYNSSNHLKFTLLFEEAIDSDGSIVTLYIDGQVAITNRMYLIEETNFGFYGLNSDVTITDLKKFK